ncbi:Eaf3 protein [Saccharomycopsis crataegensis]|uniref:Chromatin modification-related protein EAF3 n=1 Tax=Saccharomycopsis crataegensis TaxID=43959 RepID=A0AAV5QUA4_9ASCO|nr:Eaf3 protein [Saccharomycopsis crataegensis]
MSLGPNVKCLAYHGPLLYEAKVLKVYSPKTKKITTKDGEKPLGNTVIPQQLQNATGYFIHYKGWKASWDEWVGDDRVLELNQENVQLQKHLKDSVLASTKAVANNNDNVKETGKPDGKSDETEHKGGRRKRGYEEIEKPEDYHKKPEIYFAMSGTLKALLVNDWEYVTKNHQLVPLPRTPCVVQILKDFKNHYTQTNKKKLTSVDKDILDEVLSGLRLYFDNALGHILLYRFERQQYKEIIHDKQYEDKDPSEIYGAEHLLRLFSCLPGLIAQTSMDQQSTGILKNHLEAFIEYLADNKETLFIENYENTSPSYDAMSRA